MAVHECLKFITRAVTLLSVDTSQGQGGVARERLSSRMHEFDRHGDRVKTAAGRRLARDRRLCVTRPSGTRLGSMTSTARHHDADVCLLAQSLRTAIGRLASFRTKTLRDRDRVQTRELVGRYGRCGQADAFI